VQLEGTELIVFVSLETCVLGSTEVNILGNMEWVHLEWSSALEM